MAWNFSGKEITKYKPTNNMKVQKINNFTASLTTKNNKIILYPKTQIIFHKIK